MPEKRHLLRKRRRLTVEFHWDKAACVGFTYDISPSSFFVRTARIPKLGARLVLTLILPDETKVPLSGTGHPFLPRAGRPRARRPERVLLQDSRAGARELSALPRRL